MEVDLQVTEFVMKSENLSEMLELLPQVLLAQQLLSWLCQWSTSRLCYCYRVFILTFLSFHSKPRYAQLSAMTLLTSKAFRERVLQAVGHGVMQMLFSMLTCSLHDLGSLDLE